MENKIKQPIFLGGFTGVVKNENYKTFGQNFYRLVFACERNDDSHFGFEVASISVKAEVYNEFFTKVKPNTNVNAKVLYVRGGWSLIDYNL